MCCKNLLNNSLVFYEDYSIRLKIVMKLFTYCVREKTSFCQVQPVLSFTVGHITEKKLRKSAVPRQE